MISFAQPHFRTKYLSGYWLDDFGEPWGDSARDDGAACGDARLTGSESDSSTSTSSNSCCSRQEASQLNPYFVATGLCERHYGWDLAYCVLGKEAGALGFFLYTMHHTDRQADRQADRRHNNNQNATSK